MKAINHLWHDKDCICPSCVWGRNASWNFQVDLKVCSPSFVLVSCNVLESTNYARVGAAAASRQLVCPCVGCRSVCWKDVFRLRMWLRLGTLLVCRSLFFSLLLSRPHLPALSILISSLASSHLLIKDILTCQQQPPSHLERRGNHTVCFALNLGSCFFFCSVTQIHWYENRTIAICLNICNHKIGTGWVTL